MERKRQCTAEALGSIEDINGWLYCRIRMCIWKQWKLPRTKKRNLIKMGVNRSLLLVLAFRELSRRRNRQPPAIQVGNRWLYQKTPIKYNKGVRRIWMLWMDFGDRARSCQAVPAAREDDICNIFYMCCRLSFWQQEELYTNRQNLPSIGKKKYLETRGSIIVIGFFVTVLGTDWLDTSAWLHIS